MLVGAAGQPSSVRLLLGGVPSTEVPAVYVAVAVSVQLPLAQAQEYCSAEVELWPVGV